jgi:hypothetical protein
MMGEIVVRTIGMDLCIVKMDFVEGMKKLGNLIMLELVGTRDLWTL